MKHAFREFRYLAAFIIAIWLIHLFNVATGNALYQFGLEPRAVSGLSGIIAAPWLHGSFAHLISNTAGLLILGGLLSAHGASTFLRVSVVIVVVGGLATWFLARNGNHIGASGLVFGYVGYLVTRGIVERTAKGLIIAVIVVVFYSGILWGVLPTQEGVSWEGHLFGFLAGILAARWRVHRSNTEKHTL